MTSNPENCIDGESPLHLNLADDCDLIREFMQEGAEHLQTIEQGVLVLEADASNPETLNAIFRSFHTFKGGAGFLNLAPIHHLAHELESLLDLARQKKLLINRAIVDVILSGADCLKQFCNRINACVANNDGSEPIMIPTSGLLQRIRSVIAGAQESEPLSRIAEAPSSVPNESPDTHEAIKLTDAATIKVNTQKLDGLVDTVGEMVIAQSLVVQCSAIQNIQDEQLSRNLAQL